MLGRKTYTEEEVQHAKAVIGEQLVAHQGLAAAVGGDPKAKKAQAALAAFEPLFFNNLLLALDRPFVHRVRAVSGKDGNPLNEVEVICDSLMTNGGILQQSTVIKLDPEQSVTGLRYGEPVRLTAEQFARLSDAFFAELEARFR
jgi:hypothetical protein